MLSWQGLACRHKGPLPAVGRVPEVAACAVAAGVLAGASTAVHGCKCVHQKTFQPDMVPARSCMQWWAAAARHMLE